MLVIQKVAINNDITTKEIFDIDLLENKLKHTFLDKWRHIINYPIIFEYDFTNQEIQDIKDSIQSGMLTGRPSSLHQEEINDLITRLTNVLPISSTGWFVRFNSLSPKDGCPSIPLMNATDIIHQIVTSKRALHALSRGEKTLYFTKFDPTWDSRRECRVFVFNKKITAISQYYTEDTSFWSLQTDAFLTQVGTNILTLYDKIKDTINFDTDWFSFDVYIPLDTNIHIIEFNSGSFWAGRCLFSLEENTSILTVCGDTIPFRILKS
jgi:D123